MFYAPTGKQPPYVMRAASIMVHRPLLSPRAEGKASSGRVGKDKSPEIKIMLIMARDTRRLTVCVCQECG